MKRWLMWMTALALAGVLTACAGTAGQADTEHSQPVQGESQSERESPTPAPTVSEFPHEDGEGGVLVAYFSATGNTRGVAQTLQGVLDADLYEITAAEPYTQDDLNYSNDGCRANQEQNDPDARPAMAGTLENPEDYDVVFLGYPIWWGRRPRLSTRSWSAVISGTRTSSPSAPPAPVGSGAVWTISRRWLHRPTGTPGSGLAPGQARMKSPSG